MPLARKRILLNCDKCGKEPTVRNDHNKYSWRNDHTCVIRCCGREHKSTKGVEKYAYQVAVDLWNKGTIRNLEVKVLDLVPYVRQDDPESISRLAGAMKHLNESVMACSLSG